MKEGFGVPRAQMRKSGKEWEDLNFNVGGGGRLGEDLYKRDLMNARSDMMHENYQIKHIQRQGNISHTREFHLYKNR